MSIATLKHIIPQGNLISLENLTKDNPQELRILLNNTYQKRQKNLSLNAKQQRKSRKTFLKEEISFVSKNNKMPENKYLEIQCQGKTISVALKKNITTIGPKHAIRRFDINLNIDNDLFFVLVHYRGFFYILDASCKEEPQILPDVNEKALLTHELKDDEEIQVGKQNFSVTLTTKNPVNNEYVDIAPMTREKISNDKVIADLEKRFLYFQQQVLRICTQENTADIWDKVLKVFENDGNCIEADFVAIDFKVEDKRTTVKHILNKNFYVSEEIPGRVINEISNQQKANEQRANEINNQQKANEQRANEISNQQKANQQKAIIYGGGFEGSASFRQIRECLAAPIFGDKVLFYLDVSVLAKKREELELLLKAEFARHNILLKEDCNWKEEDNQIIISHNKKTMFYIKKFPEKLEVSSSQPHMYGVIYSHLARDNEKNFSATHKEYIEKIASLFSLVIETQRHKQINREVCEEVIDTAIYEPHKLSSSSIPLFQVKQVGVRESLIAGKLPEIFLEQFQQVGIEINKDHLSIKDMAEKCVCQCILVDHYNKREYLCSFQDHVTRVYASFCDSYPENLHAALKDYSIITCNKKGLFLSGDSISLITAGSYIDPKVYLAMFDVQGHSISSFAYNTEIRTIAEMYARNGEEPSKIMCKINHHLFRKYRHLNFGTKQFSEGVIISLENEYEEEQPPQNGENHAIPLREGKKIKIAASGMSCIYGAWLAKEKRYLLVDVSRENLQNAIQRKNGICNLDCQIEKYNNEILHQKRIYERLKGNKKLNTLTEEEQGDLKIVLEMIKEIESKLERTKSKREKYMNANFEGSILGMRSHEEYNPSKCENKFAKEDFIFSYSDGYNSSITKASKFIHDWLKTNKNNIYNGEKLVRDFQNFTEEEKLAIEKDDKSLLFLKCNTIF